MFPLLGMGRGVFSIPNPGIVGVCLAFTVEPHVSDRPKCRGKVFPNGPVHTNPFSKENGAVSLQIWLVHTTTPKTITGNGAIRKRSPEWSDLKTMLYENAVF